MSLNLSYYSEFHEDWQDNFKKLENTVQEYNQLDHTMKKFYDDYKNKNKQTSFLGTIIIDSDDSI